MQTTRQNSTMRCCDRIVFTALFLISGLSLSTQAPLTIEHGHANLAMVRLSEFLNSHLRCAADQNNGTLCESFPVNHYWYEFALEEVELHEIVTLDGAMVLSYAGQERTFVKGIKFNFGTSELYSTGDEEKEITDIPDYIMLGDPAVLKRITDPSFDQFSGAAKVTQTFFQTLIPLLKMR